MVELRIPCAHAVDVAWDRDRAYALVADVPLSASHFPGLRSLDDLGGGVYRWNLQRYEVGKYTLDAAYSALYACDAAAGTVQWRTIEPIGTVRADGNWRVEARGDGARLHFDNLVQLRLPLPRLAAPLARRVVPGIYDRQVRDYVGAIAARMGGRLEG